MSINTPHIIEQRRFREVLSAYATGVVVVCAERPHGPVGMACNSFTSVSLDPPLVSFCAAKASTTWPQIRQARRFCISILSAHHEDTSRRFARRNVDRFEQSAVKFRPGGPGIADAIAWIDCALEAEHEAGDHLIVVGRVLALDSREDGRPLVFWRGGYSTLVETPQLALCS